ncbi:MAG TPA: glycosyltransferase family 9 protein [Methylophilaceae bacterium]|nr:glycosyltransferase family 9 protein [Methylophilaceae bacterium]
MVTTPIAITGSDKILILTSSSTGNNVFCTPAIAFLRKHLPDNRIDVAALSELSAEVFQGNRNIDDVHVVTKARAFDRIAMEYDKVIALNSNALKKLAGFNATVIAVERLSDDVHHAEQLLQFMSQLLQKEITDADRRYVLAGSPEQLALLLPETERFENALLVNIHLGCGRTLLHGWKFFYKGRADDKKMWPIESYIELGLALTRMNPNIRIVLTGTRNEAFLAKQFTRNVEGTINLVGKTTVAQLRALMDRADLFIAHDCGVLHIAAASEIPIVALFGPTNHRVTGPYPVKPQHRLIKKESMAEISMQAVSAAAAELLANYAKVGRPIHQSLVKV